MIRYYLRCKNQHDLCWGPSVYCSADGISDINQAYRTMNKAESSRPDTIYQIVESFAQVNEPVS